MNKLLILGAGTAGTMVANRLNRLLNMDEWQVTLVDPDPVHYYQPDFIFIPFGVVTPKSAIKNKRDQLPFNIKLIQAAVEMIEPDHNQVRLSTGITFTYDYLIIATGSDIHPEETPGLAEEEWGKSIHTFYSWKGAMALAQKLRSWEGGRLVVNVVENPIKCPVAPMEFLMLSDWYFRERGMRDRVELIYATPLSGAFTKPTASKLIGDLLEQKNIHVETDFLVERADPDAKKIISYDEREVEYDLLVSIPLNKGAEVVGKSGLGDELNYSPVNPHTFQSDKFANIFVLGDASNIPASKAGSAEVYAPRRPATATPGELLRHPSGTPPVPHRYLTVEPLQTLQRFYGEVAEGYRRRSGGARAGWPVGGRGQRRPVTTQKPCRFG